MEKKRVVVTGLGALTPIGNSVSEYWENLVKGVSGAEPITRFDASVFKTQFACEVKGFDPLIDSNTAKNNGLFTNANQIKNFDVFKNGQLDKLVEKQWGKRFDPDHSFGTGQSAKKFTKILNDKKIWELNLQKTFFETSNQ